MGVTLPYTITNGTPHDAVPVQQNFEALRDGHNAHVHDGVDTPKVNFANIDGKPATYPPSAHTHPGTDVTSAVASATNADTVDGFHASATAAANTLLALDASGKLPASITGDAATVGGASPGTGPKNVLKLDSAGKVPVGNLPSGIPADTVDGYHVVTVVSGSLDVAANGTATVQLQYSTAHHHYIVHVYAAAYEPVYAHMPLMQGKLSWQIGHGKAVLVQSLPATYREALYLHNGTAGTVTFYYKVLELAVS